MKATFLAGVVAILLLVVTVGTLPKATVAEPEEWTYVELPRADWYDPPCGIGSIDMVNPDFGVVLAGGLWEYRAGTFIPVTQTFNERFRYVAAVDLINETCGWAVGGEGLILRFDGQSWQEVTSPTTHPLTDVAVASPSDA